MKEFSPSPDFVEKTMAAIGSLESGAPRLSWYAGLGHLLDYAGAAGAILIGLINLVRFLGALYAPVIGH